MDRYALVHLRRNPPVSDSRPPARLQRGMLTVSVSSLKTQCRPTPCVRRLEISMHFSLSLIVAGAAGWLPRRAHRHGRRRTHDPDSHHVSSGWPHLAAVSSDLVGVAVYEAGRGASCTGGGAPSMSRLALWLTGQRRPRPHSSASSCQGLRPRAHVQSRYQGVPRRRVAVHRRFDGREVVASSKRREAAATEVLGVGDAPCGRTGTDPAGGDHADRAVRWARGRHDPRSDQAR